MSADIFINVMSTCNNGKADLRNTKKLCLFLISCSTNNEVFPPGLHIFSFKIFRENLWET